MGKIFAFIDDLIENLCKVFMAAQVLIVTWIVFGRFVLHKTPMWGESTALMAMVWFSLLSASIGVRDDSHLRMSILEYILPKKYLIVVDYLNWAIMLGFSLFLLVEGIILTKLTAINIMPGIGIPSSWLYLSIPAAGIAIAIQLLRKVRKIT